MKKTNEYFQNELQKIPSRVDASKYGPIAQNKTLDEINNGIKSLNENATIVKTNIG
jgi:hypothetical protein